VSPSLATQEGCSNVMNWLFGWQPWASLPPPVETKLAVSPAAQRAGLSVSKESPNSGNIIGNVTKKISSNNDGANNRKQAGPVQNVPVRKPISFYAPDLATEKAMHTLLEHRAQTGRQQTVRQSQSRNQPGAQEAPITAYYENHSRPHRDENSYTGSDKRDRDIDTDDASYSSTESTSDSRSDYSESGDDRAREGEHRSKRQQKLSEIEKQLQEKKYRLEQIENILNSSTVYKDRILAKMSELATATQRAEEETAREVHRRHLHQHHSRLDTVVMAPVSTTASELQQAVVATEVGAVARQLEEEMNRRNLEQQATAVIKAEIESARAKAESLVLEMLQRLSQHTNALTLESVAALNKRTQQEAEYLENALTRRRGIQDHAEQLQVQVSTEMMKLEEIIQKRIAEETAALSAQADAQQARDALESLEIAIRMKEAEVQRANDALATANESQLQAEMLLLEVVQRLEMLEQSQGADRYAQEFRTLKDAIETRVANEQAAVAAVEIATQARDRVEMLELAILRSLEETRETASKAAAGDSSAPSVAQLAERLQEDSKRFQDALMHHIAAELPHLAMQGAEQFIQRQWVALEESRSSGAELELAQEREQRRALETKLAAQQEDAASSLRQMEAQRANETATRHALEQNLAQAKQQHDEDADKIKELEAARLKELEEAAAEAEVKRQREAKTLREQQRQEELERSKAAEAQRELEKHQARLAQQQAEEEKQRQRQQELGAAEQQRRRELQLEEKRRQEREAADLRQRELEVEAERMRQQELLEQEERRRRAIAEVEEQRQREVRIEEERLSKELEAERKRHQEMEQEERRQREAAEAEVDAERQRQQQHELDEAEARRRQRELEAEQEQQRECERMEEMRRQRELEESQRQRDLEAEALRRVAEEEKQRQHERELEEQRRQQELEEEQRRQQERQQEEQQRQQELEEEQRRQLELQQEEQRQQEVEAAQQREREREQAAEEERQRAIEEAETELRGRQELELEEQRQNKLAEVDRLSPLTVSQQGLDAVGEQHQNPDPNPKVQRPRGPLAVHAVAAPLVGVARQDSNKPLGQEQSGYDSDAGYSGITTAYGSALDEEVVGPVKVVETVTAVDASPRLRESESASLTSSPSKGVSALDFLATVAAKPKSGKPLSELIDDLLTLKVRLRDLDVFAANTSREMVQVTAAHAGMWKVVADDAKFEAYEAAPWINVIENRANDSASNTADESDDAEAYEIVSKRRWQYVPRSLDEWRNFAGKWEDLKHLDDNHIVSTTGDLSAPVVISINEHGDECVDNVSVERYLLKSMLAVSLVCDIMSMFCGERVTSEAQFFALLRYVALLQGGYVLVDSRGTS
jgi:hypothetical protein